MDLSALLLFAGALLINAGTPGPSIGALVARVVTRGPGAVLPFLAAMWIGEALWLTVAVCGLTAIAARFALVFAVIKCLGIAYLLVLAWRMWHQPATAEGASLPEAGSASGLFMSGMAVTLGNPKLMAFYLAVLPALIDLRAVSLTSWAELVSTMAAVLIAVDLAWVLAATAARRLLRSPRAVRISNRVGAVAMGGAAIGIAAK
jgi:threonine/homoserine/homoserine lactone efflux protein